MIIIEFSTIFQILVLGVVEDIFSVICLPWKITQPEISSHDIFATEIFVAINFAAGNFTTGNSVALHLSCVKFYPHYIWRMIFSPRAISPLGISSPEYSPHDIFAKIFGPVKFHRGKFFS